MLSYRSIGLFISSALAEIQVEKEHYIEAQLLAIHDIPTLESYAKYENVVKADDKINLRSAKGKGSILNINEEITTDNWSFEFQVKNLIMTDVEKAGMYVWYTDKEVKSGSYKGGNTVFNGFLTGIEFSKDRADIVFSFNYGLDFKNKELQTMRFDHINPSLIDHLDHLVVKVIHTERNFKIEIYDTKNNLLSDSFRIHEPLIMNQGPTRKHFAITTNYEQCPKDIVFDLSSVSISSRKEHETYDYTHIETEPNQYPRNKSDEELRVAIADIAHFMNYLVIVLGSKSSNTIVEMAMEAKKKLRMLQSSIDSLVLKAGKVSTVGQQAHEISLKAKIDDLENSLANNIIKIEEMKNKFKFTKKNNGLDLKGILLCGSLAGLLFAIAWELKGVISQFLHKSKAGKNE